MTYESVLITGASSGLGEEFAMQLAPRVRQLVLVARREALLRELANKIITQFPHVDVVIEVTDLASADDRDALCSRLAQQGIVPDLLINNAGLGDYGEFITADWSRLEAQLKVEKREFQSIMRLIRSQLHLSLVRYLGDGAKPSQRDLARGKVRRATAIRTRGRVYDEIRPASATANWQAKRPTRASRSVRKRR